MSDSRLILASGSPRRRTLLEGLGLAFEVIPSRAEETADLPDAGVDPVGHAVAAALAKAADVGRKFPGRLVVAADTVVVLDGEALGKPADAAMAREMLSRLAGREHRVVTAVAVGREGHGWQSGHEVTRVWMRAAEPGEIEAYVRTGEPMDKAGAYAIQGKGSVLVDRIEGCYFNVVGLPLARLARMLGESGVRVLGTGGDDVGARAVRSDHKGPAS